MKFKFITVTLACLTIAPVANAYNHIPLTPSWIKNVYENVTENRDTVWRGEVLEVLNPTQILVKDLDGNEVAVNLLHLTLKRNGSTQATHISTQSLQALIGKQIYVLGTKNKSKLTAKILDVSGNDINLNLVENGAFDINTTSLNFKYEKQQYINALNNAKSRHLGVWK